MKNNGNNNIKNLVLVCSVVIAAVLFVLSTMRMPEDGGETAGIPVQVEGSDSWSEASDESADSPSEVSDEDVGSPSEAPNEDVDSPSEVLDESTNSSVEELPESVPESVESILEDAQSAEWADVPQTQTYSFRNERLLNQHYEKHGIEMGFATIEEYVAAANAVINHPDVLHKLEAEDNDDVYFLEATNELVVVSTDGFIRTYFIASGGIDYYNRQ